MVQQILESGATIFKTNTSPGSSLYFLDPDDHKYIVENIANLEKMPAIGAYVLTLPIKRLGLNLLNIDAILLKPSV